MISEHRTQKVFFVKFEILLSAIFKIYKNLSVILKYYVGAGGEEWHFKRRDLSLMLLMFFS